MGLYDAGLVCFLSCVPSRVKGYGGMRWVGMRMVCTLWYMVLNNNSSGHEITYKARRIYG